MTSRQIIPSGTFGALFEARSRLPRRTGPIPRRWPGRLPSRDCPLPSFSADVSDWSRSPGSSPPTRASSDRCAPEAVPTGNTGAGSRLTSSTASMRPRRGSRSIRAMPNGCVQLGWLPCALRWEFSPKRKKPTLNRMIELVLSILSLLGAHCLPPDSKTACYLCQRTGCFWLR